MTDKLVGSQPADVGLAMDGVRMNHTFNDVAGKLNFLLFPVSLALPLFELFPSETDTFS